MLVVKLDIQKNKEDYKKVVDLLADYDIVSVAWDEPKRDVPKSGQTGGDLAQGLSAAVDNLR